MPASPGLSTTRAVGSADPPADFNAVATILNGVYKAIIGTTRTASFTLAAADSGELIPCNSASAITVTVPVLSAGHTTAFLRQGAGTLTVAASGTTIVKASDVAATARVQGSVITVAYLTSSSVLLTGDLT